MNRTIYKYPLQVGENKIRTPLNVQLLTVLIQYGVIVLYAIVEKNLPNYEEWRHIRVIGTGHECYSSKTDYIGTVQHDGFVWHVFDEGREQL